MGALVLALDKSFDPQTMIATNFRALCLVKYL